MSYILFLHAAKCQWAHSAGLCGAGPYSDPACSEMCYIHGLISAVCALLSLGCWAVCDLLLHVLSQRHPQFPGWTLTCHEPILKSAGAGGSFWPVPSGAAPPPHACHVNQTQSVSPSTTKMTGIRQEMSGGWLTCIRGGRYSQRLISYTHLGKGRSCALLEMSWRSLSPPPHWQHEKSRHVSITSLTLILGSNPVCKIPSL